MTTEIKISRTFRICVWIILLCTWLVQALTAPNFIDADAVGYLDISYSCISGNWHALVNGYWSPGLPFLLALWIKLFHVGPFREPLALHLFAVVSLIGALASFEYFLSSFFTFRKKFAEENQGEGGSIPDDAIRMLGYALFFWISTFLTPPYLEQPDILVFALYLIAAAICLRLMSSAGEWWRFGLLGVVLALGYLTKAVMFPLAFTFIAVLVLRREWQRVLPKVLLATVVFAAVSAPFIFELSKSKGRLTYGDAGVVNYRHVMGMDAEENAALTTPRPVAAPHVEDFAGIINLGTYPPWADPSFSYKGTPTHFNLRRQINRTHIVLHYYFELYIELLGALVTGVVVLMVLGGNFRGFAQRLLRQWVLWVPAIAGLGLYALVRAEGRMLAGFTVGLFVALLCALRVGDTDEGRRTAWSVVVAVSIILISQSVMKVGHEVARFGENRKFPDWEVATTLRDMGLKPGERVSFMGEALTDHAWAHLARVRMSAEIPAEDALTFWTTDQTERTEVQKWLVGTGARVLVTRNVPRTAMSMGWRRVGNTDYYILNLP